MTSEVVHAQEEPDPAGVLLPDYSGLALAIGSGKEEARLRPWWTNNNPSLRTPLGRDGRRVFDELEPKDVDEEANGRVIVVHH